MSRTLSSEEEALVELGIQASFLLSQPPFESAINTLSEHLTNAIISTQVEETVKRERFYLMHSCLVELVGILKSRVATKDNIEVMVNQDDDVTDFTEEN